MPTILSRGGTIYILYIHVCVLQNVKNTNILNDLAIYYYIITYIIISYHMLYIIILKRFYNIVIYIP